MPFLSAFPKRRVRLFEIYARVLERLADTRRGFDHLSVGSGVNPKDYASHDCFKRCGVDSDLTDGGQNFGRDSERVFVRVHVHTDPTQHTTRADAPTTVVSRCSTS